MNQTLHGCRRFGLVVVVLAMFVGRVDRLLAQGPKSSDARYDPMVSAQMRADARLHDVCFVSPTRGWAVGDRGTIWHTDDGGLGWRLQVSGVSCPLYSVCFFDEQVGLAAGGFSHPYGRGSAGVLLSTSDGGQTWKPAAKLMLPKFRKIRFFDRKNGFALGDSSAFFPSGLFVTQSGGHDWRALRGEHGEGWIGGDLLTPETGILTGAAGAVATVRRGAIDTDVSPHFGLRTLRAVQLLRPRWGWLVGDGGLVALTGDLGTTWRPTPAQLPEGVAANFDFAALAVRGPKCWVAGTPGTRVLRTEDAGKTWTVAPTGQNAPIHAMTFVDDRRGWAVGALGTILATDDGGQTWRRQRAGGSRAALLGLFSRPADVPLEVFVQFSGDEGYLGVVNVVNRDDVDSPSRSGDTDGHDGAWPSSRERSRRSGPLEDRLREAVARAGASDAEVAWRFPCRSEEFEPSDRAVIDDWDRTNDGRGLAALEAYLVRQIRLWRPEVVVTHGATPTDADPGSRLLSQAVLAAVDRAADGASYADQITGAGLEPWQVKKVYGVVDGDDAAPVSVNAARIAPQLGRSLGQVAADARAIVEDRFTPGPDAFGLRPVFDRTFEGGASGDLFDGLELAFGGDARRASLDAPAAGQLSLEPIARKRRNVLAILRRSEKMTLGGPQLLAHVGELTEGLDAGSGTRVLFQLADQYRRRGQWTLAAETLEALADRYPDHPLAGEALVWLVQYYASAEAAWRIQGAARTAAHVSIGAASEADRPAKAAELAKRIGQMRPELLAEPAVGFPLSAADRMRGLPREAERFLAAQRGRTVHDAWWRCAQGEGWVAQPSGKPLKPVLRCAATATKPKLDGQLDEPCWQQAEDAVLAGPSNDPSSRLATVKMAHDDQFLYVACRCPREAPTQDVPAPGPRPRDADLSGHDRLDLLVDVNRDYMSYYRLSVDYRGWTRDDCWGDPSWDPTWFVATAADDASWTVEVAIPLDQLAGRSPGKGEVWGLGVQRLVPGVGFQSWNAPASPRVMPEGFGYLVFE